MNSGNLVFTFIFVFLSFASAAELNTAAPGIPAEPPGEKEITQWRAEVKADLADIENRRGICKKHPEDEREILSSSITFIEKSAIPGAFAPSPAEVDAKKLVAAGGAQKVKMETYCECKFAKLKSYLQSLTSISVEEAPTKMAVDTLERARGSVECALHAL